MKCSLFTLGNFFKILFFAGLLIAISSFNSKNSIEEKQKYKEKACPVSFSFSSSITFVSGAVSPQNGTELVNYNFNSWSGFDLNWSGSICFTVQFPSLHPAGTLTFSKSGTVLQTINIARNSGIIYDLCDSNLCGGQYEIEFN